MRNFRRRQNAKEKSLDLAAVQTWLAAWSEKDLYSDAAVRDLLSLMPDNDCMGRLLAPQLGVSALEAAWQFCQNRRQRPAFNYSTQIE
jgi:hypothetical protein